MWPGLEIKACRFHFGQSWWRKIQSLRLSRQYGKKDSELSQFLKTIFGLSVLPPAEVCDCLASEFLSSLSNDKRVEQFCSYLLENYILFRHKHVGYSMPTSMHCFTARNIKCLFLYLHCKKTQNKTYIKMRSVTTRRFRKSATFKQEDLISSKSGQYRVNLISRIEFVSSVLYKLLTNTHL